MNVSELKSVHEHEPYNPFIYLSSFAAMRSRSSSCMADGLVDDHVPLNRIVVINPDVHQSTNIISSDETTPSSDEEEYDAETFLGDEVDIRPATIAGTSEDVGRSAKFTESPGAASGWFAKLGAKKFRDPKTYTHHMTILFVLFA